MSEETRQISPAIDNHRAPGNGDRLTQLEKVVALMEADLIALTSPAYGHATVLSACNKINPAAYQPGDKVFAIYEGKLGQIAPKDPVVDEEGFVTVIFNDMTTGDFNIGLDGERPEVRLLGKSDGTNVVLLFEGVRYEVNGVFGKSFTPGQAVKINTSTKAIVSTEEGIDGPGEVCLVKKVIDDDYSEIEHHGQNRVVFNGKSRGKVTANERVQVDHSGYVIVRGLGKQDEDDYTLDTSALDVKWEDIGGCDEAKLAMRQALEYPQLYPDLFAFYNRKPPKGLLLYGPTGCGKTMLLRAAALSVANAHGKKAAKSGLIMVKGPELLSKWVGTTEERVRALFKRGRDHYKEHGYPPILGIDEAESLLPTRGSNRSSDVEKTIVPQFLSEMDGVEDSPVMVILLTNRPDMLDPAIVRPGRIDRHIKVPRPDQQRTEDIFRLHLRGVPLHETSLEDVAGLATVEMFKDNKVLYRIRSRQASKPLHFALADCINGAMIKATVELATDMAMERDRLNGKPRGVRKEDFIAAVVKQYEEQIDQNHQFDLEDYFGANGLNPAEVTVEKLRVTK